MTATAAMHLTSVLLVATVDRADCAVSSPAQPQLAEALQQARSTPGSQKHIVRLTRDRGACDGRARRSSSKATASIRARLSLIGSMSKPITGVCIATLIRDGKLAFTTPLREALAGFFRRHGPPADRRLRERDDRAAADPPLRSRRQRRQAIRSRTSGAAARRRVSRMSRRRSRCWSSTSSHPLVYAARQRTATYSNTGFVVLTAVIEEARGKPYEAYCRDAVFDAARHHKRAAASGLAAVFRRARLVHYAARTTSTFLDVFDPRNPFLGDAVEGLDRGRRETRLGPECTASNSKVSGISTTHSPRGLARAAQRHARISAARVPKGQPIEAVIHSHAYREPSGVSTFHAMTPAIEDNPALGDLDAGDPSRSRPDAETALSERWRHWIAKR